MPMKLLALMMILVVMVTFGLSKVTKAEEIIKAKVEAINKEEKKIVLAGKEYRLTDETAQADVDEEDEVEATVDGDVVKEIKKID